MAEENLREEIFAIEKEINHRWGNGDTSGYFDRFIDDVTYTDPISKGLVVGKPAVIEHVKSFHYNAHIVRDDYLKVSVQPSPAGDSAVLSYDVDSYNTDDEGNEKLLASWTVTIVYAQIEGAWRILHGHWTPRQS